MKDKEVMKQLKVLHKKYPALFISPKKYQKGKEYLRDVTKSLIFYYSTNKKDFPETQKTTFMNIIKKVMLDYLSMLMPKGSLKSKLGCWFHNRFSNNNFKIYYKNGVFITRFKDFSIKTYQNLHFDLEKPYLKHYNLKKGDVIVDAGTSEGAFVMYASKIVGDEGKVIAFEPNPINYEKLKKNVELNHPNNVIILKKGLWSKNTFLEFNDDLTDRRGSSFVFHKKDIERLIKVQVVRLDDELKKLGINKVDFFKADIEGAEVEAMKGFIDTLEKKKVNLAIASYHLINNKPSYLLLEDFFRKINYNVETSYPIHLTTYAFKG